MKTKLFFVLICNLLICPEYSGLFSQNITNTLGTSGTFTIKDGSTSYFTLTQSTGQVNILKTLRLETSTGSTTGVIYYGSDFFMHNYGSTNTFIGISSGNFSLTDFRNTGIGAYSLSSLSTGIKNSALGIGSLFNLSTGYNNSSFGAYSQNRSTSGNRNSSFGVESLYWNTSANDNSAFGYQTLYYATGSSNSGFGRQSLYANTSGYENSAFGYQSLRSITTGFRNTAIGYNSGFNITTGNNNICIGYDSQPTSSSATNQITLGDGSINSLRCNVQSISSLSDARDKKNISDLSLGLDFLMKLKPRQFNWDKREWYENNVSDGSKIQETKTAGFIAQELDEIQLTENAGWLNLVLKDNPEKIEATYGNLLPVMVKAIQELNEKNEKLEEENKRLSTELRSIVSRLEELEKIISAKDNITKINNASGNDDNER